MKVRIVRGEGYCEIPYEVSVDGDVEGMCERLDKIVEEELRKRLIEAGCDENFVCECDPVTDPDCEKMNESLDFAFEGFHKEVMGGIRNTLQGYGGVWKVYDTSGDQFEFTILYAPKRFTDTLYKIVVFVDEGDTDSGYYFETKAKINKFVFEEPIDVERLFAELEIERDLYELIVYGITKDENDVQDANIRLAKPLYVYEE